MEFQWLIYIAIGLLCGTFGAALGLGSGVILVPILVIFFAYPQKEAQGITLAMMVPMAMVGAWRYKTNPDIDINLMIALWLSVGAIFGALLGAAIADALPGAILRRIFAVVLLVAAGRMLFAAAKESKQAKEPPKEEAPTLLIDEIDKYDKPNRD